ncbi:hypothetical protein C0585_00535 [Candidatus Woesearchaeota archaeon]|nr:MAG: hypothetical protein C0585_00535 [Candidatus Woesearchaeota archaeon]
MNIAMRATRQNPRYLGSIEDVTDKVKSLLGKDTEYVAQFNDRPLYHEPRQDALYVWNQENQYITRVNVRDQKAPYYQIR